MLSVKSPIKEFGFIDMPSQKAGFIPIISLEIIKCCIGNA